MSIIKKCGNKLIEVEKLMDNSKKRHQRLMVTVIHNSVNINKQQAEYRKLLREYAERKITLKQLEERDPVNRSKPENRSLRQLLTKVT